MKSLTGLHFAADGVIGILRGVYEHFDEIHENDLMLSILCIMVLLTLRVR